MSDKSDAENFAAAIQRAFWDPENGFGHTRMIISVIHDKCVGMDTDWSVKVSSAYLAVTTVVGTAKGVGVLVNTIDEALDVARAAESARQNGETPREADIF